MLLNAYASTPNSTEDYYCDIYLNNIKTSRQRRIHDFTTPMITFCGIKPSSTATVNAGAVVDIMGIGIILNSPYVFQDTTSTQLTSAFSY